MPHLGLIDAYFEYFFLQLGYYFSELKDKIFENFKCEYGVFFLTKYTFVLFPHLLQYSIHHSNPPNLMCSFFETTKPT